MSPFHLNFNLLISFYSIIQLNVLKILNLYLKDKILDSYFYDILPKRTFCFQFFNKLFIRYTIVTPDSIKLFG